MQKDDYIKKFKIELERFKKWLGEDLVYYLINTAKSNGETYKYVERLINSTENVIESLEVNLNLIDDILYVLAIDNEVENIKDYIIENCNDKQIELIIGRGYNYYLADARWQIAVIIKERYLPKYEKYLEALKNDSNSYVRKRADFRIDCSSLV